MYLIEYWQRDNNGREFLQRDNVVKELPKLSKDLCLEYANGDIEPIAKYSTVTATKDGVEETILYKKEL